MLLSWCAISWVGSHLQPHRELVDTTCRFPRPEGADWSASKNAAENCPESVGHHDPHNYPGCDLELLRSKDAKVLKDDRTLGQS
jgi:hypothetical protein